MARCHPKYSAIPRTIHNTERLITMQKSTLFAGGSRPAFPFATGASGAQQEDRPKTKVWLNIGYTVEVPVGEDGATETRFISLPVGIPVDTTEGVATNSSNDMFRMMQEARNDLLEELQATAEELEAGEERIIGEAGGLQLQLRRVADEQKATPKGKNPFSRKALTAPAEEAETEAA